MNNMDNTWIWLIYPLVMTNSLLLKIAIEIVSFPIKHGGFFHSYVKLPEGKWAKTWHIDCIC